ncbi:MAG: OmpH family outer membrane protein [Rikenellaceae bacterium]|nr:OmpH family outer membrane protein [Rikenellaceae bacterium]
MKLKFILPLFFLGALYACDKTSSSVSPAPSADTDSAKVLTGKIAFVNNDTLVNNYKLFKELSAKLEAKSEKVGKELDRKSRSLQTRAAQFNEKITKGLVTRAQAEEQGAKLQSEQQYLLEYRDKVLGELEEEQAVMFNNIWNNITEYLVEYNQTHHYDLILNQNSATNTVLVGNPSMDITKEVVEALNKKFDEDKAAGNLDDLLGISKPAKKK